MNKKLLLLILTLMIIVPAVAISQSSQEENNKAIMTINGKEITGNEYLIALEVQKRNIEKMRETKNKIANAPNTENKAKALKQIEKKLSMGSNKMAAAKLLYDNIILSEAENKGLLVPLEEAKQYAANIRSNYSRYESSPDEEQQQEFISAMDIKFIDNELGITKDELLDYIKDYYE